MTTLRKSTRHRPTAALRPTMVNACAIAVLALTLTACNGDGDSGAASSAPGHTATTAPGSGGAGTAATTAGAEPAGTPKASAGTAKPPSSGATTAPAPAKPAKPAASTSPAGGCDHKMPISPDEIAVYRYTPEGGSLNLIVKYGNWGCAPADSDGAPFVTVGKETYLPMDQAAYVTATNPIVESTENQHIGVQELLDWLEAHPDSGLVFKYHLGADGAIDRLEEVFTP
ncbi:hypothetical protein [Streptomyces collinus]|uniref:hypothetical protein n=1 Tax=Streptomyces collinus TaxID=42684 RepID=UPI003322308A